MAGQLDYKMEAVLRNQEAMNQHVNETRMALREAESHIIELKNMVATLQTTVATQAQDLVVVRAQLLGGGPT